MHTFIYYTNNKVSVIDTYYLMARTFIYLPFPLSSIVRDLKYTSYFAEPSERQAPRIRPFVVTILSRCYSALTLDRQRYARASLSLEKHDEAMGWGFHRLKIVSP